MKILYVDMQYDYGIKARGRNIIGLDGFKTSFERLGHDVEPFFYDEYLNKLEELQIALQTKAEIISPDLIFFSLYQDQFELKTLESLKEKYTTINWFGDDQWRFDDFTSKYANAFTYCITTDKYAIPKYNAIGQNNVIYSQWAAIDSHDIPPQKEYKYDVSFVGGYHPYRKWFISELKKRGINVQAFGNGWQNGPLSDKEMNELFVSSKINLNISNSNSYDIRYLFDYWKNIPRLLRAKKRASQIKARNFEISYFNGFQLSDYVPTVEDYFVIGKEIVCYSNVDEAALLIKYYLENEAEREKIKELGSKRAQIHHGYIHRLELVLETIK